MKYFGTAGIRGKTNFELTTDTAYKLGRAVGIISKKVCVARDTRKGSEMFMNAVITGLIESGAEVINCGIVPLGALANFTRIQNSMGIMVTGSHIPPNMNGLVVMRRDGSDLSRKEEREIEKLMDSELKREEWINLKESVNYRENCIEEYMKLLEKFAPEKRYKIVLDCANGSVSTVLKEFSQFVDIVAVNSYPSGLPPRKPEPRRETLEYLAPIVKKFSALAVGVDMDGDRAVYLDEKGRGISEDVIGAFFASKILKKGDRMVTPVNSSMLIEEISKNIGFEIHYCPIGPPEMAEKIREVNAKYSYEETGKYIFPPHTLWGDALLSTLFLLKNLGGRKLSEVVGEFPQYHQVKVGINCPNALKKEVMKKVFEKREKFLEIDDVIDVVTIDGLKIIYRDSWLLIRQSGTEPLIRVFSDSLYKEKAKKLVKFGESIVKEIMKDIQRKT